MRFLGFLYVFMAAAFVWTFLFQIVAPYAEGRPFFPILRKKSKELEYEIASAKEDKFLESLQRNLEEIKPAAPAANNIITEVK